MATKINENTNYCFFNVAYQKVIDDYQHLEGGKAILYRAHLGIGSPEGPRNQIWVASDKDSNNYFSLPCVQSVDDHQTDPTKTIYVLGIDSNNSLTEVPKDTTQASQRWMFQKDNSDGTQTPSFYIISKKDNNMVVTAPNGNNETQLVVSKIQTGSGATPQRWIAFPMNEPNQ